MRNSKTDVKVTYDYLSACYILFIVYKLTSSNFIILFHNKANFNIYSIQHVGHHDPFQTIEPAVFECGPQCDDGAASGDVCPLASGGAPRGQQPTY